MHVFVKKITQLQIIYKYIHIYIHAYLYIGVIGRQLAADIVGCVEYASEYCKKIYLFEVKDDKFFKNTLIGSRVFIKMQVFGKNN